jgi:hypothetical protein
LLGVYLTKFGSANFQIKLAPLILYTTLVYTSTLKSAVQKIFKIFVILIKKILLFFKELSYFLFFNINQCFSEKNRIEVKHTFFFVFGIKISLYNVHYWLVYPFLLSSFWTLYSVLIVWHQKVNVFGPAHIEKSHFKGVVGCIFDKVWWNTEGISL